MDMNMAGHPSFRSAPLKVLWRERIVLSICAVENPRVLHNPTMCSSALTCVAKRRTVVNYATALLSSPVWPYSRTVPLTDKVYLGQFHKTSATGEDGETNP